jgi:PAS domain S-box-containing protein
MHDVPPPRVAGESDPQRQLRALARLTRLISSSLDQDDVLGEITRAAAMLTGAQAVVLWLADEPTRTLELGASFLSPGAPQVPSTHLTFDRGGGIGRVASRREPLNVADVFGDGRFIELDWWRTAGLRSFLALPIVQGQTLLAVIGFGGSAPFSLTAEDEDALQTFLSQAALAIRGARLHAAAQRRGREARALAEIGGLLIGTLDPVAVGRRIVTSVSGLLGATSAALYLIDGASGDLVLLATSHPPETWPARMTATTDAAGRLVAHAVAMTQRRALLGVPLLIQGRAIGMLHVADAIGRRFEAEEVRLAEAFAQYAALALEAARLFTRERAQRELAETLGEVARDLVTDLDSSRILRRIVDAVGRTFAADAGLFDVEGDVLVEQIISTGAPARIGRMRFGEGVAGVCAERRSGLLVNDYPQWPQAVPSLVEAGIRHAMAQPLIVAGELIGVLALSRAGDRAPRFSPDDLAALQRFAEHAVLARRNAALYEAAESGRREAQALALENARLYAQAERRRRETELTAEIARTITASLDLAATLQRVVEGAQTLVQSDFSRIALRMPRSDDFAFRHWADTRYDGYANVRVRAGRDSLGGLVLLTGRPVRTDDWAADPRFTKALAFLVQAEGTVTEMAVPIRIGHEIEGLLYVNNRARRPFTDLDEATLMRLAEHAAIAIRNAQLFEDAQRRRLEAETLEDLAASVSASLELDTVLQRVTEGARRLTDGDIARIALRDPGAEAAAFRYVSGPAPEGLETWRIEPGKGLGGLVLATGAPVRTDDYAADPGLTKEYADLARLDGSVTGLGVPLRIRDDVQGVLLVFNRSPRPFTDGDQAALVRLASHAALAIERAQLFAREQRARAEVEAAVTALRESESRTTLVIETAMEAVVSMDGDERITGWNLQAERMFGWSRDEALGQPMVKLIVPSHYRVAHERGLRHFLAGGRGRFVNRRIELTALHRDGREFPVELSVSATLVRDGVTFNAFVRDITERRAAEVALRASEQRYRELFENARDVIFTLDLEGRFTSINAAAESLFGYTRDEALRLTLADVLEPAQLLKAQQAIASGIRNQQGAVTIFEFMVTAKDGRQMPMEVSTRFLEVDGRPVGIQGIARDVTARRQMEEQLRQSQKMEALGRLAGGIAHDFNNLLTVIMAHTETVAAYTSDEDAVRSLEVVRATAERAAALTQQLLTFSRRRPAQRRTVDLHAVLNPLLTMLGRIIGGDVRVLTSFAADLMPIVADPAQIEQVVMNLALNARDAMAGGGTLFLSTHNTTPDDDVAQRHPGLAPGRHVVLSVSDTGVGMAPEVAARIFEPFFTTKKDREGTGLGLANVYAIVQQHRGVVEVDTAVNRGTTFRIYLPCTEAEPAARPLEPERRPGGGSETILLAEDEPEIRSLVGATLRRYGYRVLETTDGRHALAAAEAEPGPIHLLLTDVIMPEIGGLELVARLTRLRPDMRVLYMTGYSSVPIQGLPSSSGAVDVMWKPFKTSELARKVREVLNRAGG